MNRHLMIAATLLLASGAAAAESLPLRSVNRANEIIDAAIEAHGVGIYVFSDDARSLANLHIAGDGITGQYYAGDVFEVIVYGLRLDEAQTMAVREYLREKYEGLDAAGEP